MRGEIVKALPDAAQRLADVLKQDRKKVVFAESCTAGLIAATLARIPGISDFLCGSAVVYRNTTKSAWLGVSAQDLAEESIGPVSEPVAAAMAVGVLELTPEADFAASVTGHLGPGAPEELDGVVYVGVACRDSADSGIRVERVVRHVLLNDDPSAASPLSVRHERQQQAAVFVLEAIAATITSSE